MTGLNPCHDYGGLPATACCAAHLLPLQFTDDQAQVVYKRPTDLRIKEDVPICCNLLIAPILDEGECGWLK